MKEMLITKMRDYPPLNNPDILISFQQEAEATKYLKEKVQTLDNLPELILADGKPASGFNYLLSVLEDDFQLEYSQW